MTNKEEILKHDLSSALDVIEDKDEKIKELEKKLKECEEDCRQAESDRDSFETQFKDGGEAYSKGHMDGFEEGEDMGSFKERQRI